MKIKNSSIKDLLEIREIVNGNYKHKIDSGIKYINKKREIK